MNAAAVLIIIGSAVIGPIEARPLVLWLSVIPDTERPAWRAKNNSTSEAIKACVEMKMVQKGGERYESILELCARTMKDIGVDLQIHGKHGGVYGQLDDGTHVRCIPVPEGYRK